LNKIKSDPDSLDSKLANSTSENAKSLLRSMIGDTTNADPKTKEILIAHGIIPKDDGKFVEQPRIPEREPDYFAKAAANPVQPQLARTVPTQAAAPASPSRSIASSDYSDSSYSNVSQFEETKKQYSMPDF